MAQIKIKGDCGHRERIEKIFHLFEFFILKMHCGIIKMRAVSQQVHSDRNVKSRRMRQFLPASGILVSRTAPRDQITSRIVHSKPEAVRNGQRVAASPRQRARCQHGRASAAPREAELEIMFSGQHENVRLALHFAPHPASRAASSASASSASMSSTAAYPASALSRSFIRPD